MAWRPAGSGKTGFTAQIFFLCLCWERRATRRVERRREYTITEEQPQARRQHLWRLGNRGRSKVWSPREADEDDGQDNPADDAVPRQVVPNEQERAADASEGPPPPPAPEVPPAAPPPPPADQTATASDSAMESAPAPMESDEEQDDESVPEVPGTTI